MIASHHIAAELTLRVLLGIIFFSQGYDKVFRLKVSGVVKTFEFFLQCRHARFPVILAAYYTSYTELIGGFLLMVGFMKLYALYFLAFDLLIIVVAFSIIDPMWSMKLIFPRIVMLLALLIIPPAWSVISIDYFLMLIKFMNQIT